LRNDDSGFTLTMAALIVDGYNIIHAWSSLKAVLRQRGMPDARDRLVEVLAGYAAQTGTHVTVVFDAHARRSGEPTSEVIDGVTVRFGTKKATADHIIERLAYLASRERDPTGVIVATDDRLQRDVVGGMGVPTMRAKRLEEEVARVSEGIDERSHQMRSASRASERLDQRLDPELVRRLEALRRGEPSDIEP
jgi:predicted RNA-binding protein with PIN domain